MISIKKTRLNLNVLLRKLKNSILSPIDKGYHKTGLDCSSRDNFILYYAISHML